LSAVAEQYAVALFSLAREQDETERVDDAFTRFVEAFDTQARRFFLDPRVAKKEKKRVLGELSLHPLLQDFLFVLVDNRRFANVEDILAEYRRLKAEENQEMHVVVRSRRPLQKSRIKALKEEFASRYNRRVTIENQIDEEILGGLRFEYDGKVVDDTINKAFKQLKGRLTH